MWTVYSKYRAEFENAPAFFLDFSDRFREAGNAELALQVLSNIAELESDDPSLLRVRLSFVAARADRPGHPNL